MDILIKNEHKGRFTIHSMSLTCSSGMKSILCKLSENGALEIWKKFIEQPGFYVKQGGPHPLSVEVYGN